MPEVTPDTHSTVMTPRINVCWRKDAWEKQTIHHATQVLSQGAFPIRLYVFAQVRAML